MDDVIGAIYFIGFIGIMIFKFYKKVAGEEEKSTYKRKSVGPYNEPELESTDFDDMETISEDYQPLEEEYNLSAEYQEETDIAKEDTSLDMRIDDELEMYDEITDYIEEDDEDIYDEESDEEMDSPVPVINAENVAQGLVMAEILQEPRAKRPHRYFSRK